MHTFKINDDVAILHDGYSPGRVLIRAPIHGAEDKRETVVFSTDAMVEFLGEVARAFMHDSVDKIEPVSLLPLLGGSTVVYEFASMGAAPEKSPTEKLTEQIDKYFEEFHRVADAADKVTDAAMDNAVGVVVAAAAGHEVRVSEALDDLVHDCFGAAAAAVNNQGIGEQVRYLLNNNVSMKTITDVITIDES